MTATVIERERDGFTRAICENPADDTVRLVAADWIQDHGDPDRAEFIRDQIEFRPGSRDFDLLNDNWERWYPDVRRHEEHGFRRDKGTGGIRVVLASGAVIVFSRGFVHAVEFLNVGKYLSAAEAGYWAKQPIARVVVHGRVPTEFRHPEPRGPYWRWFDAGNTRQDADSPSLLPSELWKAFHDHAQWPSLVRRNESWEYPSATAAYDGLSAGAVALGRKLAGLPVLFGGEA